MRCSNLHIGGLVRHKHEYQVLRITFGGELSTSRYPQTGPYGALRLPCD